MEEARLRCGDWAAMGPFAGAVRTAVFVREQRIPADLEWDDWDARSLHCVAFEGERPVATGRLLPDGHIGRMAVLADWRGRGIGARILDTLIDAARSRGDARIELSAQSYVVGFYARRGFAAVGEPYDEVGIPHQKMQLALVPEGRVDTATVSERMQDMPDGSSLLVRDWRPAQPTGRGVYLLHGLGEHSGRYDALARRLCARGWQVRAHDHVGHGRSSGARGVIQRQEQLAEHATQLIDAFAAELDRAPVLLGHSMGGTLAADVALHRDAKIAALVLSSPALAPGVNRGRRMLVRLMGRVAPGLAVANGIDPQQLSHDPAMVKAYVDDPLVHRRICARLARWIFDTGAAARRDCAKLARPTLLLVAGADALVNPAGSRLFADGAPSSLVTLRWYATLRHEIFNEREPDRTRVMEDLEGWLDSVAAAPA
jgi:alpha-beta hydrolase superfamily lysophospholipase/predicted GNAT family N-acyltransferase